MRHRCRRTHTKHNPWPATHNQYQTSITNSQQPMTNNAYMPSKKRRSPRRYQTTYGQFHVVITCYVAPIMISNPVVVGQRTMVPSLLDETDTPTSWLNLWANNSCAKSSSKMRVCDKAILNEIRDGSHRSQKTLRHIRRSYVNLCFYLAAKFLWTNFSI